MSHMPRAVSIALLIGAVILAFLPFFADRFVLQLMTRVLTMTIFALSLGFLVSGGGLVSLGHAAYFGVAAYVLALASPAMEPANLLWALPLVLAVTAATAAIIGFLVVRTKGVYFIMVTLAFGQMLFHLFHDTKIAGGSDGMFLDARPVLDIFGMQLLDLQDRPTLYWTALGALVATFLLIWQIMRSPFGKVIMGLRHNELRMRALGYEPVRYKLACFVIGGTLAGLAGMLYAVQFAFVTPDLLKWHSSGSVLMMVILGGMNTLYGPILGAFAYVLLEQWLVSVTEHWPLIMGAFFIAVVLFLREGLAGLVEALIARLERKR